MSDDNVIDIAKYVASHKEEEAREVDWEELRRVLRDHYARIASHRSIPMEWADEKAQAVIEMVKDWNKGQDRSYSLALPNLPEQTIEELLPTLQKWALELRRDVAIDAL